MLLRDVAFGFKRFALHERGMRPKSFKSILASVQMLADWAGTDDISRLDHGTVKAFLYWGREERAWEARTFRNHRQYLKTFFDWCAGQRFIGKNPVDGIAKPKLPQRLPRCLSREDAQTLLARSRWFPWRHQFEGIRNETILYLFVFTGLRLQELLDLMWSDIDLTAGELLVRQGKGQKDRLVPIHPRLKPVFQEYVTACGHYPPTQHVFTGAKSTHPLTGRDVRAVFNKLSRDTGIYVTPHMLRHTFGRLSVEAGLDIFKIKEIMGHRDITTTQGYLSVSSENLKRSLSETDLL